MPLIGPPPNLTTTQRDALVTADKPKGTIVYNTTTGRLEVNDGTGASPTWNAVGGNAAAYGTALPTSSLANGQVFTLFVSYAGGYVGWQCMYRVDLDGTYPWHVIGGPPMIITAASTTLPRSGQWNLRAKGWTNTGGGTTTGSNHLLQLTVGGSAVDTIEVPSVPANSGASFSYGGSESFYGTGDLTALSTAAAGTTVAVASLGSDIKFTLMPVKII